MKTEIFINKNKIMRITSLLSNLIVEQSRFQVLYDKLVKPVPSKDPSKKAKGALPFEILKQVIFADPTVQMPENFDVDGASVEDMEKVKVGKFTQWLLKNLVKPSNEELSQIGNIEGVDPKSPEYKTIVKEFRRRYLEDLFKMNDLLKKFESYKAHIPQENRDINKLTPMSLTSVITSIPEDVVAKKNKESLKKDIRKEREGYSHPGAEVMKVGSDYTLIKIEGTGDKQKEAASWYGGYYDYQNGESHWCTSPPGSSYFMTYAKQGPLYVVLANDDKGLVGKRTGLPQERFQFHFPSDQFMDRMDHRVNLVELLNGPLSEFKDEFKQEFAKGLVSNNSKTVDINYPNSSAGKFVALYGFNELFESLPSDIDKLHINNTSKENIALDVPESLGKFTGLQSIMFTNLVKTLPDVFDRMPNLYFLSLTENKQLESIPESVADADMLNFLVLVDSNPSVKIPERLREKLEEDAPMFFTVM